MAAVISFADSENSGGRVDGVANLGLLDGLEIGVAVVGDGKISAAVSADGGCLGNACVEPCIAGFGGTGDRGQDVGFYGRRWDLCEGGREFFGGSKFPGPF